VIWRCCVPLKVSRMAMQAARDPGASGLGRERPCYPVPCVLKCGKAMEFAAPELFRRKCVAV